MLQSLTKLCLISAVLLAGCTDSMTPTSGLDDGTAFKGNAAACENRENDNAKKLTECVTVDGVRAHQEALQVIADANGGTRASGTAGYTASVNYVVDQLTAVGYDVAVQDFSYSGFLDLGFHTLEQIAPASSVYTLGSDYRIMTYTADREVTAPVAIVDLDLGLGNASTSGCDAADFAGFPAGAIALIQRGACSFQLKAENAAAAGAVGAMIFNQGDTEGRKGVINGTLSPTYAGGIPVVSITYDLGVEFSSTPYLVVHMDVNAYSGTINSQNVIADNGFGDASAVILAGAHLDSVTEGPGIQDNGSGSAALLENAIMLARAEPAKRVRFAWWGAEEAGLLGSTHYVDNLSTGEMDAIEAYLNFDMIASPNHVYYVLDGDGSSGVFTPEGSAELEDLFASYYETLGIPFAEFAPTGGSDYASFMAYGIPVGGLFTGSTGIKTPEEEAIWGGSAGDQYDPCYHLACDTFDNISLQALDVNSDAMAYAIISLAQGQAKPKKLVRGGGRPASAGPTATGLDAE